MSSPDGPDFICVGLQKAGTQWLYDQLQGHPDFWMPPVKELHFFDRDFPDRRVRAGAEAFVADPAKFAANRLKNGHAPVDDRAAAFLRAVADFDRSAGENRLSRYAALFAPKGELVSGDITPGYSILDDDLVDRIAGRFDRAKVVLMLREPAARLWSAWRMHCEEEWFPALAERNVRKFEAFIDRPLTRARSYPTEIARRWSAAFGDRFRFFFLDDVATRPQETRDEIVRFLGGDPARGSSVSVDFNRKVKSRPPKRSEAARTLLRERFREERTACARMFGGAAERWPEAPW